MHSLSRFGRIGNTFPFPITSKIEGPSILRSTFQLLLHTKILQFTFPQEQYKFIYDTLEEYVTCGNSWFPVSELSQRLKQKSAKNPITKLNEYQREYTLICKQTPRFTIGDCAGGHRGDNRKKNRDVLIVPRKFRWRRLDSALIICFVCKQPTISDHIWLHSKGIITRITLTPCLWMWVWFRMLKGMIRREGLGLEDNCCFCCSVGDKIARIAENVGEIVHFLVL